jgi:hypothetical protein
MTDMSAFQSVIEHSLSSHFLFIVRLFDSMLEKAIPPFQRTDKKRTKGT